MEGFEHGDTLLSVSERIMEGSENGHTLPSVSQKADVDVFLTEIKEVYQDIYQEASISANVISISPMDSKSPEDAFAHRTGAEDLIKGNEYEKALLYSTKSIAFVEADSEELAQAYSLRAKILRHLKRFESCYEDLGRAIEISSCPAELKLECQNGRKGLKCEIVEGVEETCDLDLYLVHQFEKINDYSQLLGIPSKLLVDSDGKEARILTKEDIQPGEILLIDDLLVKRLDDSKRYTHCSFCLSKCDNLIPCDTCALEMYCSTKCKSGAFESYHEAECGFMKYYHELEGKLDECTPLATRAFLIETEEATKLSRLGTGPCPRRIFIPKLLQSSYDPDVQVPVERFQKIMENVRPAVESLILLIRSRVLAESPVILRELDSYQYRATLQLINHFITIKSERKEDLEISIPNENSFRVAENMIPEVIGYGISLERADFMKPTGDDGNTNFFIHNGRQIIFATRTILPNEKLSMDVTKHPFTRWMSDERCNWPTKFSDMDFIPSPLLTERVNFLKENLEFMLSEGSPPISNKDILRSVIEHCELLCKITKMSSFAVVSCEHLLVLAMRINYCDCYRQYNDFQLDKYVKKKMRTIIDNVYNPYLEYCNTRSNDM